MFIRSLILVLALLMLPISLPAADSSLPAATIRHWAEDAKSPGSWGLPTIPWFAGAIGDEPVAQQTEVRMSYDDSNLYIGFRCLQASVPTGDDFVEVCLDVNNDRKSYYRLTANAQGFKKHEIVGDGSWKGDWEVEVAGQRDSWTAFLTIPFSSVGLETPAPGSSWGLNLARYSSSGPEATCWSRKGTVCTADRYLSMGYDAAGFGTLFFGGPEAEMIALPMLDIASPGRHGGVMNYDLAGRGLLRLDILNKGRQSARLIQEVSGRGKLPFGILLPQEGRHAVSFAVYNQGRLIARTPELSVNIPEHRPRLKEYIRIVNGLRSQGQEQVDLHVAVGKSLIELQNSMRDAYGSNEAWAGIGDRLDEIEKDVQKLQEMSRD